MSLHLQYMEQAIALSERARLHAPPNPWVGCVIVNEGQIVGEGFTQPPGQAHAEVCALRHAGEKAKGATLYSTLEPCSHTGRTPPCTNAIIQAGIRSVCYGIKDPDLRVSGNGIRQLEEAGIQIIHEIGGEEIQQSLKAYIYQRRTNLPFTILKTAMSLDGCLAAKDGTSQWLTCDRAREDVHFHRAMSQAILIGSETALKDFPRLTARHALSSLNHQPLRVLLDSKGKVPATGPLFDPQLASTLVITTKEGADVRRKEWENSGAEVEIVSASPAGVDLDETWRLLGKRSILQLLVEGGGILSSALLMTPLVNHLLVYICPLLLGQSGIHFFQKHIATLSEAQRLSLLDVQKMGECVRLEFKIKDKNECG